MTDRAFRCVSLFTGAGGLDIGFERAGFETIATCEIDKAACQTLTANQGWRHDDGFSYFPNLKIEPTDIRTLSSHELGGETTVDCVIGGPPCQAFSSAGAGRSVLDQRGQLVYEYLRVISDLRPKAFLFENVRGVVTARGADGTPGQVIRELFGRFEELGYSCRAGLLNSADYGSYQRRVRCFVLGVLEGDAPHFPTPTHYRGSGDVNLFSKPWNSLGEFLERYRDTNADNFVFPSASLQESLEHLPDGSGIKSPGVAEATRPGGHWGYRQGTFIADRKLPARTVTGSASQDWVRDSGLLRRLTLREVQLLQGFPSDWKFSGSKAEQFKQIGNAVPTIFGEALGKIVKAHLSSPASERVSTIPFPEKFNEYINYTKRDHARNASARKVHRQYA